MDAEYVIPDSTGLIRRGPEGQAESWAGHFADFKDVVYVRTPIKVKVSDAYPHAMETGTWIGSRSTAHGKQEKGGEHSAIWRKVEGVWKIRSELFVALYCHGEGC